MGFLAITIAPWLSSIRVVGCCEDALRSVISSFRSHTTSWVAKLSATNSASEVDSATTARFLLSQLIGLPAIKNTFPVVEWWSSNSPAQSESV